MLRISRYGFFIIIIILGYIEFSFSEEISFELDPIVVTKTKPYLLKTYTLDSYQIKDSFYGSLTGGLKNLPLDLQSRNLKADIQTDFSLRGSSYQGVLILIDGQRINDPKSGHYNCDLAITKEDIERIELIPGLGSSLFGPDALGGAVNIILKKPKEKSRIIENSFGSYQTIRNLVSFSEKKDNLGIRFSLEEEESAGFYFDTDFKRLVANLKSSLDIPYKVLDLDLGYLEKEFGAYDFYTPAKGYPSKEWIRVYHLNIGSILENQTFWIKPNLLWRRHYDKFMLDKTFIKSTTLNHHRSDVYIPSIYFQKETKGFGRLGLGIEYGFEEVNSTVLGKRSRGHKSIVIDNLKEFNLNSLLGASLRIDDYEGFAEAYTGSLALRYKILEDWLMRIFLSRSIRLPTFHELYYADPTTVGNSGLSCEKALNYELGFDYEKDKFLFGLTLFLRKEKNLIDWVRLTPHQPRWQAENITKANVFGLENYLRLKIKQNLSLDSYYTYIDKWLDDAGCIYKYGPNYSRHLFNTYLNLDLSFGAQRIGFSYKKRPQRDGWFLINLYSYYQIKKGFKLFLEITNLLNVEYQEIEGIPQPPRWIQLGLRLEW
ncbi:MAG: TonB-dependent receptor [Candidatus Omnitrophica bacterium]|nr:TonB-dependent receptor [Candidatus Omnitrophota bacterium]